MGLFNKTALLLGALVIAVFFQNCSDPFQFRSFGNGDPYEGYSDPPDPGGPGNPGDGGAPPPGEPPPSDPEELSFMPLIEVDPDLGAETQVELACFSTHSALKEIWIVRSLKSEARYMIVQFKNGNGEVSEMAVQWSSSGQVNQRQLNWQLSSMVLLSRLTLSYHFAEAIVFKDGKFEFIEFTCSK